MSAALTTTTAPRHLKSISEEDIVAARRRLEAEEAERKRCITLIRVDLESHHKRLKEITDEIGTHEQQIAKSGQQLAGIKNSLDTARAEHKKLIGEFNNAQAGLVQQHIDNLRTERNNLNATTRNIKSGLKKLYTEQEKRTEQANKLHNELRQLEKPVILRPMVEKPAIPNSTPKQIQMRVVQKRDSPPEIELGKNWRDQLSEQDNLLAEKLIEYAKKNGKGFNIDTDNKYCAMSTIHECCRMNHSIVRYCLVWVDNTLKIVRVCGHWNYVANIVYNHILNSLPKGYGLRLRTTSDLTIAEDQLIKQQDYLRRNSETVPCVEPGSSVIQSSPNQNWLAEQGITADTQFTCTESGAKGTAEKMFFIVPTSGKIDWRNLTIEVIRKNTITRSWFRDNKPNLQTMDLNEVLRIWAEKKRKGRA